MSCTSGAQSSINVDIFQISGNVSLCSAAILAHLSCFMSCTAFALLRSKYSPQVSVLLETVIQTTVIVEDILDHEFCFNLRDGHQHFVKLL